MKVLNTKFLGQLTIKVDENKSPDLELKYNGISLIRLDEEYYLQSNTVRRPISRYELPLALMAMELQVVVDNQFKEVTIMDDRLGHYIRYDLNRIELGRIGSGKVTLTRRDSGVYMETHFTNGNKNMSHTFYEGSDINFRLPVLLVEALDKLSPFETYASSIMNTDTIF